MTRAEVLTRIEAEQLIAIVRLASAGATAGAVRALAGGGVSLVEISLASAGALGEIEASAAEAEDMVVGAGTVLEIAHAERALAAGARFLIAPNFDPALAVWAEARDVLYVPGALTPSEVAAAARLCPLVKLFPAGRFGPAYIRDLLAPFPSLRLIPTGGVTLGNAPEFLAAGAVAVAVGSALVNETSVREERALSAAAAALRAQLRSETQGGQID